MSFSAAIIFQPAASPVPAGYVADSGAAYGSRGNGLTKAGTRPTPTSSPETTTTPPTPATTRSPRPSPSSGVAYSQQLAVPNGTYPVRVVAGDRIPIGGRYRFNLEGTSVVSGQPTINAHWLDTTSTVAVADGTLSLTNGAGADKDGSRINFIEVVDVPSVTAAHPAPDLHG